MSFGLPKQVDDWFYFQFLLFFVIGFLLNVFSNGQATLIYINQDYDMQPNFNQSLFSSAYSNNVCQSVQKFTNQTYLTNKKVMWIILFLYWIVSPLVNIIFALFIFKKEMWKTPIPINQKDILKETNV